MFSRPYGNVGAADLLLLRLLFCLLCYCYRYRSSACCLLLCLLLFAEAPVALFSSPAPVLVGYDLDYIYGN